MLPLTRRAADDSDAAGGGTCRQPQPGAAADAQDWDCGAWPENANLEAMRRGHSLISCAAWRSSGRTGSGAPTSHIVRLGAAFPIWWRRWTGRAGRCSLGGCRTAMRNRWRASAADLRHRPGQPVYQRPSPPCWRQRLFASRWNGRGRWTDNVFIGRSWRSLKHEDIYLKGYVDGREAHIGIAACRRPHRALGSRTPMARGATASAVDSSTQLWT